MSCQDLIVSSVEMFEVIHSLKIPNTGKTEALALHRWLWRQKFLYLPPPSILPILQDSQAKFDPQQYCTFAIPNKQLLKAAPYIKD